MAQTFHLRHLIVEAWLKCQERLCVICGGHIGPRTGFPPRTSPFLVSIVLPMLHTLSFYSSGTDPLHPYQLSTYENIPYYSALTKYLPPL